MNWGTAAEWGAFLLAGLAIRAGMKSAAFTLKAAKLEFDMSWRTSPAFARGSPSDQLDMAMQAVQAYARKSSEQNADAARQSMAACIYSLIAAVMVFLHIYA